MNPIVKAFSLASLMVLGTLSCQNPNSTPTSTDSEPLTHIDLSVITDTMDLDFFRIGDRVEIIPLETDPDALIGGGHNTYVLNDEFIAVESNDRLLLFNRDGSFNKVLSRKGKGPGEYVYVRLAQIFENVLWYTDAGKPGNDLNGIDLVTGDFFQYKLAVSGRIHDFQFVSKEHICFITDSAMGETLVRFFYEQGPNGELRCKKTSVAFSSFLPLRRSPGTWRREFHSCPIVHINQLRIMPLW